MIVSPHPITRGKLIIDLASRYRLPTIYPFDFHVRDGGLISYGVDQVDQFRSAATYVDRILELRVSCLLLTDAVDKDSGNRPRPLILAVADESV
jgi:ABC-type uncharacterized transport system substrate-binding protein